MAYINGKPVLFSPKVNITHVDNYEEGYHDGRAAVVNPFAEERINEGNNAFKYWAKNAIDKEKQIRNGATDEQYVFMSLLKPEDTKNETDFGHFYAECTDLTYFPEIDTSNGEAFDNMFWGCKSLIEPALFDTSKGKFFMHMFANCSSMMRAPKYDTSNGEKFTGMFSGCTHLERIQNYDTRNGINFQQFIDCCWYLLGDYTFDTSNGTNFRWFARNCQKLEGLHIDVSNATDLTNAFQNCNALVNVDLGVIPVSVSFANSKRILFDSLLNIIKGLKIYYEGAPEYMKHTITLSADSWENLYDNVLYFIDPLGTGAKLSIDEYIARKGWLRA